MIYLASQSPRRLQLLNQIGIKPTIINVDIDETRQPDEPANHYAARLAAGKAKAGLELLSNDVDAPVIGADTVVVCDDKILGKPRDKKDGIAMLQLLSGRTHNVITAVAIMNSMQTKKCIVESEVTFTYLTPAEIEDYWNTGEPQDKAGAYAIQGLAAAYISCVKGSYSAVVGLPLFEVAKILKEDFAIRI
jgi:nucleoside triphosphate pyrophosphatase